MSRTEYVLGSAPRELNRLILQAEIIRPITERLLRQAGLKPGMRVLDLGCGVGDVSLLAAGMVGPFGAVVGVDQSPEAIALAKDRARDKGLEQIDFCVGAAQEFSSPKLFDVVIGRYVLLYQSEPANFIRAARQNVCPGGIVAFHELSGYRICHSLPLAPAFQRVAELLQFAFHNFGPSGDAAGRLPEHFLKADLPFPTMFAEVPIGGGVHSPLYAWWAETMRTLLPAFVKEGTTTQEEMSIDTLEERLRSEAVEMQSQIEIPMQVCAWARV